MMFKVKIEEVTDTTVPHQAWVKLYDDPPADGSDQYGYRDVEGGCDTEIHRTVLGCRADLRSG